MMPKSLLGRSLLMILIPLVAVQAVTFQMFYGSHVDIISRRLTTAIAEEIALTAELMNHFPGQQDHDWILARARGRLGLEITLEPGARLTNPRSTNILGPMDDDLQTALIQLPAHGVLEREQFSFNLPPDAVRGSLGLRVGENDWVTIKSAKPFTRPLRKGEFVSYRVRDW